MCLTAIVHMKRFVGIGKARKNIHTNRNNQNEESLHILEFGGAFTPDLEQ